MKKQPQKTEEEIYEKGIRDACKFIHSNNGFNEQIYPEVIATHIIRKLSKQNEKHQRVSK